MAEQTKKEIVLESIDGMSFKVEATYEKNNDPLPEKEWLVAKIVNFSKKISDIEGWKDSLKWEFLIFDESAKNRKIWADTSLYFSQGSKTYNWCLAVLGQKEIPVGEEIAVDKIKGSFVYIMIVPSTKKKGRQVVSDLKFYDKKAPEDSDLVEDMKEESTKKEAKVTKAAEKKAVAKEEPEADEINLDDINLDDV